MRGIQYVRRIVRFFYRNKLRNRSFSLITNNCTGGVISHDLHLRFLSPTVNLFIENEEFVLFLEHLDYYLTLDVLPFECGKNYPVGVLKGEYGDIHLYFMHYKSFSEAKGKWNSRKQRIDFDNVFIIMESLPCGLELLKRFDKVPFQNKVVITDCYYPEISSCFPMPKGFYTQNYWKGKILEYPRFGIKRYLDRLDYVSFFNHGIIKKRFT